MSLHLAFLCYFTTVAFSSSVLPKRSSANLLQAARRSSVAQTVLSARAARPDEEHTFWDVADKIANHFLPSALVHPEIDRRPESFFRTDAEQMDELPEYNQTQRQTCHPKCVWNCGHSNCNTRCKPICKAPKCITACGKMKLKRCKRTCSDPRCFVVCPPQCEHGTCPQCKTVCGSPVCHLDCGDNKCESTCADPECAWNCEPDPACAKPQCSMACQKTVCEFGNDDKLPSDFEAPYLGQEIAWKGLGSVPTAHLADFAPKTFNKVTLPGGPKMMKGATMVPAGGLKSVTSPSITVTAAVEGTHSYGDPRVMNTILAPGILQDTQTFQKMSPLR